MFLDGLGIVDAFKEIFNTVCRYIFYVGFIGLVAIWLGNLIIQAISTENPLLIPSRYYRYPVGVIIIGLLGLLYSKFFI
ncbi:hypothetical protein SAMN05421542_1109 [Chryseobacterium jejuense]|uniref:Uncharacterized protein n=1 Tax=Chryseobacterium jejuense TaxID=445960 RepID=A0A2X2VJL6_CHRJE|nr:hypothetical protein SAMN05421542_1109 [Chryseobacterium jejuense]SQB26967.1 Uncharacterised protein [Chryseobacterium jejuense]